MFFSNLTGMKISGRKEEEKKKAQISAHKLFKMLCLKKNRKGKIKYVGPMATGGLHAFLSFYRPAKVNLAHCNKQ